MGDPGTALGLVLLAGLVIAVLLVSGSLVSIYNSLIQVKNNIGKAFANIEVLLQQRHDELTKLLDVCKAYMEHERSVLEDLTRLRVGYDKAPTLEEKIKLENQLNRELNKLGMVWENYPQLRSTENFQQLQGRIAALEGQIADRRELFNDSINIYNIQIESFPQLLMAPLLGYKRQAMLEVPDEKKQDVKMKFA